MVGLQDALYRVQAHPPPPSPASRPVQWVAFPGGGPSDDPLHGGGRQRLLAGLARLVAHQPFHPSAMKRACHGPTTGFDLPDRRDLGGAAAIGRGEDDIGSPHMLLRRVAI